MKQSFRVLVSKVVTGLWETNLRSDSPFSLRGKGYVESDESHRVENPHVRHLNTDQHVHVKGVILELTEPDCFYFSNFQRLVYHMALTNP